MLRRFGFDLHHAARALAAKPGFTLAALPTLALGIGVNAAVALAGGRPSSSRLVGISQYDWASFLAGALLLSAIVIAATASPARRALRVAPNVALRYE